MCSSFKIKSYVTFSTTTATTETHRTNPNVANIKSQTATTNHVQLLWFKTFQSFINVSNTNSIRILV